MSSPPVVSRRAPRACRSPAPASVEALRAFVAERLAPYKRPSKLFLVASLPATATGKILKGVLRQQAQEGHPHG